MYALVLTFFEKNSNYVQTKIVRRGIWSAKKVLRVGFTRFIHFFFWGVDDIHLKNEKNDVQISKEKKFFLFEIFIWKVLIQKKWRHLLEIENENVFFSLRANWHKATVLIIISFFFRARIRNGFVFDDRAA